MTGSGSKLQVLSTGDTILADRWRHGFLLSFLMVPPLLLIVSPVAVLAYVYIAGLAGMILLVQPRLCFLVFVLCFSVHWGVQAGRFVLMPADMVLVLAALAAIMDFLLRGNEKIRISRFDLPFVALILATMLSIPMAYNPSLSITPAFRIIAIYVAFRLTFKMAVEIGVGRLLNWYVVLVTILAAINSVLFVLSGGHDRVFGSAWLTFETLAMTALPIAIAMLLWSGKLQTKLLLAFCIMTIAVGIFATQSRAPMLAVALAVPVVVVVASSRSRGMAGVRRIRPMRWILPPAILVAVVMMAFHETIFAASFERISLFIGSMVNPQGTIALRIVLWTGAIEAFLANPFLGIGIGNFRVVDQIVTDIRLTPVWYYIGGMSAHNVVLQYLAETGILGGFSIVFLAGRGLVSSYTTIYSVQKPDQIKISVAIFAGLLVFALTILFMRAWTWSLDGYVLAFLFGLAAAWQWQCSHELSD